MKKLVITLSLIVVILLVAPKFIGSVVEQEREKSVTELNNVDGVLSPEISNNRRRKRLNDTLSTENKQISKDNQMYGPTSILLAVLLGFILSLILPVLKRLTI